MSKWQNASRTLIASLLWAEAASAQSAVTPNSGARSANPAPAAAPNAAQGTPPTTTGTQAASPGNAPVLPQVDDPMLVPPPPAMHVLGTWQEALATLRRDSTSLKVAQARIEQARAQSRVALASALPSLAGSAAATQHLLRGESAPVAFQGVVVQPSRTIPSPAFSWNASLGLNVPLLATESWYRHGTALDQVESSMLDSKEVERQQIATAAAAIINVVTSERLAEVSRVSLGSALSTLNLTKRRAALGAASTVDVLRVEQEVSDSRAQLVATHEELLRARETLGNALGSAEPWGVTPQIQLDSLAADARSSCSVETSVDQRPDVRAASAAVNVAERNVKAVDYGFVPTIDAQSALTYWSPRSPVNNEHVTWTIGAVLNWNIYDGGVRSGSRAVNRSSLDISRQQLSDARRRAQIEVQQAVRGVEVANANLAVSTRSREIATETARLTQVAYLNGTGTSFDLVDSARRLRAAEIDLAIKEFQVLQAKITALLSLATCRV